ncbi:MAG: long-chain fatty acid--CoA ligase [Bacteroidales bacterium]|nr:long-chain fatty acid--CoA ligase [Bacteroidales bacterium]
MEVKRTFDFLDIALETFPKENAFNVKRNGKWEYFSTNTIKQKSNFFSSALIELGLKKGDKIVSISNNRPEWNIADFGMAQIGIIHVPVYPTLNDKGYSHIFAHSDAKVLLISSKELYNQVKHFLPDIETIEHVFTFDKVEGAHNFGELLDIGENEFEKNSGKIQQMTADVKEGDISSIIYTSGTTGTPKGVMLTHKNIVSNVIASRDAVPEGVEKAISFLPINHVFERMMNLLYVCEGMEIYYAESVETLVDDIKDIKPHVFASVPRLLEKIYDKIYAKGLNLKGIKKGLFFSSLRTGQKYEDYKSQNIFFKAKLALDNKLVFSKWREALGGEIKVIVSGGAALQPRLARVFGAAKIPIIEGYGLTETSPVISVNRIGNIRAGTVGQLHKTSEVKIAQDGEILFKGPCLMKGYYKDKDRTSEAIDKDGWFHTGDMGELNNGILKITGRKKELFKLSTGKYVAPQLVENIMKETPFIEQLMVVGENERFCSAVISPNFEYLKEWAKRHEINIDNNEDLIKNEEVLNKIQREIDELNLDIDESMAIKKFVLVNKEWGPDTGELSPTLKLKRDFLTEKYLQEIESLYNED